MKIMENSYRGIMFCADCEGRMPLKRKVRTYKSGTVHVHYNYRCPNSQSYGKLFCKGKSIAKQKIDKTVETSLRVQMDLFFEAQETMLRLNRTRRAKNEQEGYKREMELLRGTLERTKGIASGLYEDFADGVLNEKEYLLARKRYRDEEGRLEQLIAETDYRHSIYQEDFAKTYDFTSEMEKYRNFEKLTPEIVQTFIKAVWVVD